jgi:acyl-CoA synthetase (AMP-forming)/AMP-acid ligase II
VLDTVVREAAERWGDRSCIVAPAGWTLSYRDLDRLSDEVAAGLLAGGVAEGDLVAVCVPTSPDHVVALAACAKAGAVCAGVNPGLTEAERAAVLGRLAPRLLIDAGAVGDSPATVLAPLRLAGEPPPPLVHDPDRPLAVVLTSGTTGTPKGATFAGRQIRFVTAVDTGMRWGGGGPTLGPTSLAHLGPTTKLAGNLLRGGTIHLLERWRAADALRLTAEHRMATLAGIPTQLALVLHHPELPRTDLSSVRAVVLGGGPAAPTLVRHIRDRLGVPVAVRYSCTEAGTGLGTAFSDPPEDAEVSVGRPHPGVELSVRDPAGGAPVAAGEVGEVCLRSPAVMSGYWRDREATAAAFWPDGFVRTGDLGRVDAQGRLRLAGRARDMYVRGGYNVFPMEVEGVLAAHPLVREVAVVPRADDILGEIGVAVVVPAEPGHPPQLDDLRRFAAARLAHHKLPGELRVVDALPLTPMEKVDKRALRALVASGSVSGPSAPPSGAAGRGR